VEKIVQFLRLIYLRLSDWNVIYITCIKFVFRTL